MTNFLKNIDKRYSFLNTLVQEKIVKDYENSGHSVVLLKLNPSHFDIVFYQDYDRYQVQIIPKHISGITFDAPIVISMLFNEKKPINEFGLDNLIKENWDDLQLLCEPPKIENTTAKYKKLKTKYQKRIWG